MRKKQEKKDCDYDPRHSDAAIDEWYGRAVIKQLFDDTREAFNLQDKEAMLTFDGEHGQIEGYQWTRGEKIFGSKGSAACTSERQPMDQARSFWITKDQERARKHRDKRLEDNDFKTLKDSIEERKIVIDSNTFKCMQLFLGRLPYLLGSALRPDIIADGWSRKGIYPHDWIKLKKTCPGWKRLTETEQDRIEGIFIDHAVKTSHIIYGQVFAMYSMQSSSRRRKYLRLSLICIVSLLIKEGIKAMITKLSIGNGLNSSIIKLRRSTSATMRMVVHMDPQ